MKRIDNSSRGLYRAAHGAARSCRKSCDVAGYVAMVGVLRQLTKRWDTGTEMIPFRLGKILRTQRGSVCYRLDGPYLSGRRLLRAN